MKTIPKIIPETIAAASHVILVTHVNPDGDALGSLLGFADILQGLGKKVFAYLEEPVSSMYDFLPNCSIAEHDIEALRDFALQAGPGNVVTIALDSGDAERLGVAKDILLKNSPFLVIDHHRGHRQFGDELWLEPECSSTGEMVYELVLDMGIDVSVTAAFCLYVAIVTDTGSFRYDCTSPRTLRIAADLLEKGVRPAEVAGQVYDNYTLARLRLMELVLSTLTVHASGRIGIISVSAAMLTDSGAEPQDVEGFVNFPRSLRSVEVAAFIKETKEGSVSVSLRAKGKVDVAAIATAFNGGGHRNAAGFRFTGKTLAQVQAEVLLALQNAL
jgi:bifunctional oligoribonuclease and PAP phosphatase NrnA